MNILVTGGGSEEPIDNVRSVCNFSTGNTAASLCNFFSLKGNSVTEIVSERAVKSLHAKTIVYKTFSQLKEILEKECKSKKYDVIIHAAAVSDYSPVSIFVDQKEFKVGEFSKLPRSSELTIKMELNPKLVTSIKSWTEKKSKLVAFKLTSNASLQERKEAVKKIFDSNNDKALVPDFIVSNDLSEITKDFHLCKIFDRQMNIVAEVKTVDELAGKLLELL